MEGRWFNPTAPDSTLSNRGAVHHGERRGGRGESRHVVRGLAALQKPVELPAAYSPLRSLNNKPRRPREPVSPQAASADTETPARMEETHNAASLGESTRTNV